MKSAVAVIALTACTPILHSTATIDGSRFAPTACRSGDAFGYDGVELSDADGRRIRLATNLDGSSDAYLFTPGRPIAASLGDCGPMSTTVQASRINGVYNLYGSADLQCSAEGHELAGRLEFKNCH